MPGSRQTGKVSLFSFKAERNEARGAIGSPRFQTVTVRCLPAIVIPTLTTATAAAKSTFGFRTGFIDVQRSPSSSLPFNSAMARSASALALISTKPNPLA